MCTKLTLLTPYTVIASQNNYLSAKIETLSPVNTVYLVYLVNHVYKVYLVDVVNTIIACVYSRDYCFTRLFKCVLLKVNKKSHHELEFVMTHFKKLFACNFFYLCLLLYAIFLKMAIEKGLFSYT